MTVLFEITACDSRISGLGFTVGPQNLNPEPRILKRALEGAYGFTVGRNMPWCDQSLEVSANPRSLNPKKETAKPVIKC